MNLPLAHAGLAYKAYEIEELVDIWFFRRLGYLVARASWAMRLTPNGVSMGAAMVGALGGSLLYSPRFAMAGVGLLIVHGIFDSADGQLARLTGRTSELGRVLDGAAGYVTHVAAYLAILLGALERGGSTSTIGWALAAGIATVVHAQMYDYHRTTYARIAITGVVSTVRRAGSMDQPPNIVLQAYEMMQRGLAGRHSRVERVISSRAIGGLVGPADRERYRRHFYRLVRFWNLFGDNVRRLAIGVLAIAQSLDWLFVVLVVPLNAVFVAVWLWQQRADRQFLREIASEAEANPV